MKQSFLLCFFVLLTICYNKIYAQGFSNTNGRNHPELEWQVAETAHFKLHYPKHLAGIENEAAAIAEETYRVLSQNLKTTFKDKIPIYFSDEDEIMNGFATPLLGKYSCIWVNINEAGQFATGEVKWLRKVISHELVHLFHYQAISVPKVNFIWTNLFGTQMERHWAEGLAQYYTEKWDAARGDRWLRRAILEDRTSYEDGAAGDNGRVLYAVGNAQVRHFATQYGDSTLAKILAWRKKTPLGFKVHDFPKAFKAVTGMPYSDFNANWRRFANVMYNTMAAYQETPDSLAGKKLKVAGQFISDLQPNPADTAQVAVVSLTSLTEPIERLVLLRPQKAPKVLTEGALNVPFAWRPLGKEIVFSRNGRVQNGGWINDLFMVNVESGKETRLTTNRRAISPTFSPKGDFLAYIAAEGKTANVWIRDMETGQERKLTRFTGDVQGIHLTWHPNGQVLAFAYFDEDGSRPISLIDAATGEQNRVYDGKEDFRSLIWSPDGTRLALTSLKDDVPNIFMLDLATRRIERVTRLANGASVTAWAGDELYAIVLDSRLKDDVYRFAATKTAREVTPVVPDAYTRWKTHRPALDVPWTIPANPTLVQNRNAYKSLANLKHMFSFVLPVPQSFSGISIFSEPLGKHQFIGAFALNLLDLKHEEPFFWFSYANNQFRPSLMFSAVNGNLNWTNQGYRENRTELKLDATFQIDRWFRPFRNTTLTTTLGFADRRPILTEEIDTNTFVPIEIPELGAPLTGKEAVLDLTLRYRLQKPYALNAIFPKVGTGLQLRAKSVLGVGGEAKNHLHTDAQAYHVLPLPIGQMLLTGRMQARFGKSLPQDHLGLSDRFSWRVGLPIEDAGMPLSRLDIGDRIWVRGSDKAVMGDRVAFGNATFRLPPLDLKTGVLGGVFGIASVSPTAFFDAGATWRTDQFDQRVLQMRTGWEIQGQVVVFGLPITAGGGYSWDVKNMETNPKFFWRVQTVLPF